MRQKQMIHWLVTGVLGCAASVAGGEDDDKGQRHLFNPTPRPLMREMSADRPDTTESPYTVDAGHAQFELSFFDYTRNPDGDDGEEIAILPTNAKVGLLHNVDLQLVVTPHVRAEFADDADESGFGDTQLRLKANLWGNDGGPTALALMPFVQFPTSDDGVGSNDFEGGIIVPFAVALPNEVSLGLMAEVDFIRNEDDDGYAIDVVHTAVLGHDLIGDLAGYLEYIGVARSDGDADYLALVGGGLTYGLSSDVQLDTGVNFGITDSAADFNVFAGITFRI